MNALAVFWPASVNHTPMDDAALPYPSDEEFRSIALSTLSSSLRTVVKELLDVRQFCRADPFVLENVQGERPG